MKFFDWINKKETENSIETKIKTEFEKVFVDLKEMGKRKPSAKKTYDLLKELNFETTKQQSDKLILEFNNIKYHSNVNSYFYFYFPIVTHILFYKNNYENEILNYLIGPNFANGEDKTKEMIKLIQGAMDYKLSENENYLTTESKKWIMNILPNMEREVEREIQKCWKELNE